jgi:glutamate-1-semialdehyde 2,1-aminomutase
MLYQRSSRLFAEAAEVIPGGVNSPVRAFKAVGGTPILPKAPKGRICTMKTATVSSTHQFVGTNGAGSCLPARRGRRKHRAELGTSFGMPTELETQIAALAVAMVPNIEKIRFVNSGTEACMSAIRLARGYTKRDKIIKFAGCYHGHSDSFLIKPEAVP